MCGVISIARDLLFVQEMYYHTRTSKEIKDRHFEGNGQSAICVSADNNVTHGHRVVPIKWDPDSKARCLGEESSEMVARRVMKERFPLRKRPQWPSLEYKEFPDAFMAPACAAADFRGVLDTAIDPVLKSLCQNMTVQVSMF